MKCLEYLSLVDDKNLDELKKDIEKLILEYVDFENSCLKIFNNIRNNLTNDDIIAIVQSLSDEWFLINPIPIRNSSDFKKVLKSHIFDFHDGDWGIIARDIEHIFGSPNNLSNFNLEKKTYWFYRDDANWDPWLLETDDFLEDLEDAIINQFECYHPRILRTLKEIQNRCDK